MKGRLFSYLQEHIVIGFNSSCYDIPLVKAYLLEYLLDKIKFVILEGKSFTCLTTAKLKFLDIKNYKFTYIVLSYFLGLSCATVAFGD